MHTTRHWRILLQRIQQVVCVFTLSVLLALHPARAEPELPAAWHDPVAIRELEELLYRASQVKETREVLKARYLMILERDVPTWKEFVEASRRDPAASERYAFKMGPCHYAFVRLFQLVVVVYEQAELLRSDGVVQIPKEAADEFADLMDRCELLNLRRRSPQRLIGVSIYKR